jgi:hypothetical protein
VEVGKALVVEKSVDGQAANGLDNIQGEEQWAVDVPRHGAYQKILE